MIDLAFRRDCYLSWRGEKIPINRSYNAAINMDDAIFNKSPHANHGGERINFSVAFRG